MSCAGGCGGCIVVVAWDDFADDDDDAAAAAALDFAGTVTVPCVCRPWDWDGASPGGDEEKQSERSMQGINSGGEMRRSKGGHHSHRPSRKTG